MRRRREMVPVSRNGLLDAAPPTRLDRAQSRLITASLASLFGATVAAVGTAYHLVPQGWKAAVLPLAAAAFFANAAADLLGAAGSARRPGRFPVLRMTATLGMTVFVLAHGAAGFQKDKDADLIYTPGFMEGLASIIAIAAVVDAVRGRRRGELSSAAVAGTLAGALGLAGIAALLVAEDRIPMPAWGWAFGASVVLLAVGAVTWLAVRNAPLSPFRPRALSRR